MEKDDTSPALLEAQIDNIHAQTDLIKANARVSNVQADRFEFELIRQKLYAANPIKEE